MLKFSIVFAALLSVTVNAASRPVHGDQKTPAQYWQETGMNFKVAGQFLDSDMVNCYASDRSFVACVQALNVVSGLLKKPEVFATSMEASQHSPIVGKLVQSHKGLNLYEAVTLSTGLSPVETWKLIKKVRALQISSLKTLRGDAKAEKVDFGQTLASLRDKVLADKGADQEGVIAATVINTYLSSAVDPHTHIDPVAEINEEMKASDTSFSGIGASLKMVGKQTIIERPLKGTPALAAGLKANDVITAVDGKSILGEDLTEIVGKIRGTSGTPVQLSILRKKKALLVTVIRGKVTQKNVDFELVKDAGISVGHIELTNFMDSQACGKIASAVTSLQEQGAKSIVLDLRDNGGGLLDQAVCIGSLFVGKKVIVKTKNLQSSEMESDSGEHDAVTRLPMVTLINAGSASASEILSGALQDYQRSWIAGDRSFGKASVQGPAKFAEGIEIFQTFARFYQPSGRTNQIVGIVPDFAIDPVLKPSPEDKFALREADLYTNALPSMGQPWVEPRAGEVAKIQACVKASEIPQKHFEAHKDDAIPPDLQLVTAETILRCETASSPTLSRK